MAGYANQGRGLVGAADTLATTPSGGVAVQAGVTAPEAYAGPALRRLAELSRAGLKRALDVFVAASVLLLLAPALLLIALAVKLESPGPLFYRAERVGRGGRTLRMLKFRKMHMRAGGSRLTVADDPRFTRVGAFLASTRLDELPQMWHVLRGDMSLVGPRPEDPEFVRARPDEFEQILSVRPGLTGLSQLAYAAEPAILAVKDPVSYYLERILPEKCKLDIHYAQRGDLRMDIAILFWTAVATGARRAVAVDRRTGRLSLRQRPGSSRS